MNIAMLEELMYQVSGLLLPPVLLIITCLFFYAFFVLGVFTPVGIHPVNPPNKLVNWGFRVVVG